MGTKKEGQKLRKSYDVVNVKRCNWTQYFTTAGAAKQIRRCGLTIFADMQRGEQMSDLIDRQEAIDALHTWFRDGFDEDKWWNSTHVLAAIEGLPPAQPEPCEDAVSRKAVKDGFVEMCSLICPYTEKQRHIMCGSCLLGTAFDVLEATQIGRAHV